LTSLFTLGVEKCRITYSKLRENNYKFLFAFKKSNRKSKSESQLVISNKKKSIISHTSCNKLVRVKLFDLAPNPGLIRGGILFLDATYATCFVGLRATL
jgi:hypothetical protein